LLCIIWIGNDDYTDIKLQGADAAAPIWAGFMSRAIKIPQYSDMKPFTPPDGVEVLRIDRATELVADDSCPSDSVSAAFLVGTAPQTTCSRMGEDSQSLGSKIFGMFGGKSDKPAPTPAPDATPADPAKHRNLLQKIFGSGKDKPADATPPPPPQ